MALFDPTDPAFIRDPYPTYADWQRVAPIFFFEGWNKWIITRYHDITSLLRDRRLGRVIDRRLEPGESPPANPAHAPFDAIQQGSLLEVEPPAHTRIRSVVHQVFTPKHVRALGARIEALCRRLVDRLEDTVGREADLITAFAEPLPVTVIADLLGIPEEGRPQLLPWSKGIIGMFEPERTPLMEERAVRAAADFSAYVRTLMAEKRRHPQDDLISRMVRACDEDPGLISEDEAVANCILFLNAGHEAVVNVIANGMLALLTHPEELTRLREDPGLIGSAVEEMMRYDTPLQFFERFVLEDLEFRGHRFGRGQKLCLYYAAANRDPEVFEDPQRFDIARDPNPHIAFGLGVHYCIGAPLARLELAAAIRELLTRLPKLRLATNELRYQPKNVFRYLTELRVAY